MKYIYTFLIFLLVTGVAISQRTVSGVISDDTGLPMIGANVLVAGSDVGTITDIDGSFKLKVPEGTTELVVSYTGYTTQTVNISGAENIVITLREGEVLDEIVVTALGVSRDEKALGYAVQKVSSETIKSANTVSAVDALAGSAAGVLVTSASGAAGAASRVVLRGQTSFNGNNQALIVVDGVRLDNSEFHTERSLGGVANSNRAMDINPNDIENISILKGAAATALYGIEGARGVLLITTKRGSDKGLRVDLGVGLTLSQVSNVVGIQDQYSQGSGGTWSGPGPGFFPNAVSWGANVDDLYYDGSDYKWDRNGQLTTESEGNTKFQPYDNLGNFFGTGTRLNTTLSVSGGTKAMDYRFSFGNSNENGVAPKNTFERTNIGLNLGSKALNDKLDLRFTANYVKTGGRRLQQGSNVSGIMLGLLRTPVSFDNANGSDDPANDVTAYQFPDNTQRNYRAGGGYDNPYWIVNNTPFTDEVNRFFGNITAKYDFTDWLAFQTTLGTDFYTDNRVQRFEIGSRNAAAGQVIEDNYNKKLTDFYFTLLGNTSLNDDFSLGYNFGLNLFEENLKNTFVQGDGLNFFGFTELGNTASFTPAIGHSDIKTAGLFGSVDIGFQNFLYLTITGRNDWSSTLIDPKSDFNASSISFFYPSVSLGLIFTEKVTIPGLSFGKLRASYAEVGGGAPSAYSTSTPFVSNVLNSGSINDIGDGWTQGLGFPFGGQSGYVINGVAGNPFLKPSKTTDLELGADLRFLNNRIGLDLTYYNRNSVDQIIAINIPNTTGFQRAFVNSGELATKGGEIVLSLTPIAKENFQWDMGFNFSKWKTTVESLPEGVQNQYLDGFTGTGVYNIAPDVDEDGNQTRVYEFGQLFGNPFQHVNDTDASGNPIFNPDGEYNPEGALVIDDNPTSANYGFPLVDGTPRILGNPNPDFLLGITNSIKYKGLSVNFLFDFKSGGDLWNGTKGALTFFGTSELTENRGTVTVFPGIKSGEGGENDIAVTIDQDWYTGNGGGFGSVSEHFIENGSFARLRYITLGYDLGDLLTSAGFDNLSLSFTGRNLFLSTPYTGFDPETSLVGGTSNGQGLDYFQMPGIRSFSVALNASF